MKILFYAKVPDATKHYRIDIPAKYLRRVPGVQVDVAYAEKRNRAPGNGFKTEDLKGADIVVLQRPVTPGVIKLIEHIKTNYPQLPIICDYDDDYFAVPRWNQGYRHLKVNEDYWKQIVKEFDGAICSTEPLAEVMRKHSGKGEEEVVHIGNGFDFEAFDALSPLAGPPLIAPDPDRTDKIVPAYSLDVEQFNQLAENKTVVAWAGSKYHYVDLDWLPPSIEKVCAKTDDILFLFVGYIQGNLVKKSKINRLFISKGAPGPANFYRMLMSLKIDIMIAPLDPNAFNQSKSNLKLMEAMALGCYPICSDWDPYEHDLDAEFTGRRVHGHLVGYQPYDWAEAIMYAANLVSDPDYRTKLRAENDAYMRSTHSAELRTEQYLNYFKTMMRRKHETFPYHSYG